MTDIWEKSAEEVFGPNRKQVGNITKWGKGKVHHRTGQEGPVGEYKYGSTLPLTSTLDGGGWSTPRPGRFFPGKDPVPTCRRLGRPQGHSGRVWQILHPPGYDPRTAQPVASRYTDRAIPAHTHTEEILICSHFILLEYWIWNGCYNVPDVQCRQGKGTHGGLL